MRDIPESQEVRAEIAHRGAAEARAKLKERREQALERGDETWVDDREPWWGWRPQKDTGELP
jgi:hypothetical protein